MSSKKNKEEHTDLELSLELEKQQPIKKHNKKFLTVAAILGLLAVAAISEPLMPIHTGAASTHSSTVSESMTTATDDSFDTVTTEQRAMIDAQFMMYTAKLDPVDLNNPQQKEEFMEYELLSVEQKNAVVTQVDEGTRNIATVTLWDNFDQDGDVVSIESAGLVIEIGILHAPQTVFIPYIPGQPLIIQGVKDGGGGITAAIETSSGAVPLPVMSVGQIVSLPLL